MLQKMWRIESIITDVETTVTLIKIDQVTDKKLLANKDQIQVIAQILKVVKQDVEYLQNHLN